MQSERVARALRGIDAAFRSAESAESAESAVPGSSVWLSVPGESGSGEPGAAVVVAAVAGPGGAAVEVPAGTGA